MAFHRVSRRRNSWKNRKIHRPRRLRGNRSFRRPQCSPDKQFRFSLTPFLQDYAGLDREVMIVGRAGQAEIWDTEEFSRFEQENLTPEKLLASLEAIGL